jgi:hypothetical protein
MSLFAASLVLSYFLAGAQPFLVVRLIETPEDVSVAILVASASARFAPGWFHALGWVYLNRRIYARFVKGKERDTCRKFSSCRSG